ncbi:hypothetical protein [Apilactobacillus apinorum]|uniref:hypothetical protein n=1 Tax=Apilactobacillus apinorum TaxID=1218495 RepID=UPI0006B6418C|nr:hypothetical protein [Apilactobacillus apinorum]CAI2691918.1 hypothetical protein AAPFHON13_12880 [Apilactobacillus apinorum]
MQAVQHTQSFFMLFAYGVFLFGAICMGLGWFFFKLRAMANKPAWDGIGGKLIRFGAVIVVIGIILVAAAIYLLGTR